MFYAELLNIITALTLRGFHVGHMEEK